MLLIFAVLTTAFLSNRRANAQTTLVAGDIMFTAVNTTENTVNGSPADDEFCFILLKNIQANTEINFTDFGWLTGGGFQSALPCGANSGSVADGHIKWKATTAMSYGTQVLVRCRNTLTASAGTVTGVVAQYNTPAGYYMNIFSTGESLLAYQGTVASPTLITGINLNSAGWTATLNQCDYTALPCTLPAALSTNNYAFTISSIVATGRTNFQLNPSVPISSDPATARATIANAASNWSYSGTTGAFVLPAASALSANIISYNDVSCNGGNNGSATVTASGGTGGYTYSWSPSGGNAATAINLSAGTYTVTITSGSQSTTANVTIGQPAAIATPTPGSNTPVCSGNIINLNTPSVSSATYSWTGPGGFTSALQNPTRPNATTAMAGTYSVTVTVGGCTSAVGTTSVVVNNTPSTPAPTSNSPVCSGNTISLSTAAVAGATYSWTGPNGFTSSVQNPTISNASTANSGTYSITVTVGGCTSAAGSVGMTINSTPATPAPSSNSPVCSGNTINLSTAAVAGATYSWTEPGGLTSSLQNPTITNATTAMSGTYSVTVTANGCTSAAGSVSVTVNNAPSTPAPSSNSPVCSGNTINLSTAGVAGATYSWTGPNGFMSNQQNPTIPNASTANSGTYSVTISTSGCTSAPGSTNVTVNPAISGVLSGGGSTVCAGTQVTLTVSILGGSGTYFGQFSDGTFFVGAAPTINVNVTPSANTTYAIALLSNGTCSASPGNLIGSATVTVSQPGTWTGVVSNNWNVAGNWCGGVPTASSNVLIPGNVTPQPQVLSGNTADANNITLNAGALTLNGTSTLNLYGDLSLNPTGTFNAAAGTVNFAGTGTQVILAGFNTANLNISGGSSKTFGGNVTVTNSVNFTSGMLNVGAYVLTMSPGATITGANASNYVRTGTGGGLRRQVGATQVQFPVGNTTYNPATLSNIGTADNYTVAVRNQVLTEGTSGSQVDPSTTYVVNRTWDISEGTPGGSNVTMTLNWSAGQTNTGSFDYTHVYISHYTGSSYDQQYPLTILAPPAMNYPGSGPYSVTRAGITSFSPFVVASAGGAAPLPVELISIAATNAGSRNQVEWMAANERNLVTYVVERSVDGQAFSRMEEVAATGKGGYITYDNVPNTGLTYYRLKMTDADGSYTYSKTVQAFMGRSGEIVLTAAPNPMDGALSVQVFGAQEGRVELTDLSGRLVATGMLSNGSAVIHTGSLAAGTYFVQFSNATISKTLKVSKQ